MLKNYFQTALRNLIRYKGFTFINVLSLTIGIVSCLVIGLFVVDELKYDKFIPEHERIFRLYTETTGRGENELNAGTPPMYATTLQQEFPEVDKTLRIMVGTGTSDKKLFEAGEVSAYEQKGIAAENTFFEIFPLKAIGDTRNALSEPNTIVLKSETAKKFFGTEDAVGKTISVNKVPFKVTAVLTEEPANFHLDFSYVYSLASNGVSPQRMQSWGWQQFLTYVKLKPGSNDRALENKFQSIVLQRDPDVAAGTTNRPHLQPLADVHLRSSSLTWDDHAKKGNITYVKALSVIGFFVLFIACFNFVNLATARSSRRAKEIGVRKVIGADRKQLIIQFIGETVLLAIVSLLIAIGAVMLLLPAVNQFTGKSIQFNPFFNPGIGLLLLGAGVLLGILAGLYPAFFLSRFQPILILNSNNQQVGKVRHAWVRRGLVVLQFTLSSLLIICTLIVYDQIQYLHNKDLGFNKDQVILFQLRGDIDNRIDALKAEITKSPNIFAATAGYGFPGDMLAGDGVILPRDGKDYPMTHLMADYDYAKTLGLKFIAGRDFSRDMGTDTSEAFVLNESAVQSLGFGTPQKALGQSIHWRKWFGGGDSLKRGKVIGVVQDLHVTSLHEKVPPTVIQLFPVYFQMAVKVKSANIKESIAHIEKAHNKINPQYPFEYKFLDDNFAKMYNNEDKLSQLLWIFAALAIFIGCLGLFGLAAFAAEQRTKEMSIRKVLGATTPHIAYLLSKNFLLLVFIASVIAVPVAWWAMNNWLENFPYKISINIWYFVITVIVSLIIALITTSFQSIKAAVENPVNSLKQQ